MLLFYFNKTCFINFTSLYCTVPYSTVPYSIVQYSKVPYIMYFAVLTSPHCTDFVLTGRRSRAVAGRREVTTRGLTSSCRARYPGISVARIVRW